jgi:hypothetical protein
MPKMATQAFINPWFACVKIIANRYKCEIGSPRVWRQRGVWSSVRYPDNWLVSAGVFNHAYRQFADRAATFFGVERDVCHRAFHREPAFRVRAVVRQVLFGRHLPGYSSEQAIK